MMRALVAAAAAAADPAEAGDIKNGGAPDTVTVLSANISPKDPKNEQKLKIFALSW
jgi:hypothetical protein